MRIIFCRGEWWDFRRGNEQFAIMDVMVMKMSRLGVPMDEGGMLK